MLTDSQRNILFGILIVLFLLIAALTIWAVFFGLPGLSKERADVLFGLIFVELILIVLLLFKNAFTEDQTTSSKIWLAFAQKADIHKVANKKVSYSIHDEYGKSLGKDSECLVIYDQVVNAYYISPEIPRGVHSIYVWLEVGEGIFGGNCSFKTHRIKLDQED